MLTLAEISLSVTVLNHFAAILQENRIIIDYEVAELPPFTQTTGLAQSDNQSPLVLSILLKGLSHQIRKPKNSLEVILYADDFDIRVK